MHQVASAVQVVKTIAWERYSTVYRRRQESDILRYVTIYGLQRTGQRVPSVKSQEYWIFELGDIHRSSLGRSTWKYLHVYINKVSSFCKIKKNRKPEKPKKSYMPT